MVVTVFAEEVNNLNGIIIVEVLISLHVLIKFGHSPCHAFCDGNRGTAYRIESAEVVRVLNCVEFPVQKSIPVGAVEEFKDIKS
jgi:hypothetical protein